MTNQPEPEQLETKELPRFLRATVAVEEWLSARATEKGSQNPEERADWFGLCLQQSGVLSTAAQLLDFVLSNPELGPEVTNGVTERLAQAIAESEAPADIVAIYANLYPEAAPATEQGSST